MDARRDQVYTALYRTGGGDIREKLNGDAALLVTELCGMLCEYDQPVLFTGDGVDVYMDRIHEIMGDRALAAPGAQRLQRASSAAYLGAKLADTGELISHEALVPHYIRKSQAEQRYGRG